MLRLILLCSISLYSLSIPYVFAKTPVNVLNCKDALEKHCKTVVSQQKQGELPLDYRMYIDALEKQPVFHNQYLDNIKTIYDSCKAFQESPESKNDTLALQAIKESITKVYGSLSNETYEKTQNLRPENVATIINILSNNYLMAPIIFRYYEQNNATTPHSNASSQLIIRKAGMYYIELISDKGTIKQELKMLKVLFFALGGIEGNWPAIEEMYFKMHNIVGKKYNIPVKQPRERINCTDIKEMGDWEKEIKIGTDAKLIYKKIAYTVMRKRWQKHGMLCNYEIDLFDFKPNFTEKYGSFIGSHFLHNTTMLKDFIILCIANHLATYAAPAFRDHQASIDESQKYFNSTNIRVRCVNSILIEQFDLDRYLLINSIHTNLAKLKGLTKKFVDMNHLRKVYAKSGSSQYLNYSLSTMFVPPHHAIQLIRPQPNAQAFLSNIDGLGSARITQYMNEASFYPSPILNYGPNSTFINNFILGLRLLPRKNLTCNGHTFLYIADIQNAIKSANMASKTLRTDLTKPGLTAILNEYCDDNYPYLNDEMKSSLFITLGSMKIVEKEFSCKPIRFSLEKCEITL